MAIERKAGKIVEKEKKRKEGKTVECLIKYHMIVFFTCKQE